MALFELKPTAGNVEPVPGIETAVEAVNASSIKFFKKYLLTLEQNKHYHFWSGGQWNMQDLLGGLLLITGPARVYITTYAISEAAVISMLNMINQGSITELHCLFDFKVKEQKGKSYLLAKNNFPVTLSRIHAKVTVIRNENWMISVTGSANWTRNPRAERQVICTVKEIVEGDIKIIEELIEDKQPFKVR